MFDWFTVAAQTSNFLILVWLMKRFLYRPITQAIDAREARIANELEQAAKTQSEAEKEREDFAHKNDTFEQQRLALLAKAVNEAESERQRLIEAARKEAEDLSHNTTEAIRNEHARLTQNIIDQVQHEVFAITRKTLAELATTHLETCLTEVFIRRLSEMDSTTQGTLMVAAKLSSEPIRVCSAFELPTEQQALIQNALNKTCSADIPIRFESSPKLIAGIELICNGQKIAWSIDSYLALLEKKVNENREVSTQ